MKMNELIRYDIPPEILQLWREGESEVLLPLQELVIKRFGLFETGNLLVQAPTSWGKTFIGEMAAIQTALRRKKVIYLVPLKALAEEKYWTNFGDTMLNFICSIGQLPQKPLRNTRIKYGVPRIHRIPRISPELVRVQGVRSAGRLESTNVLDFDDPVGERRSDRRLGMPAARPWLGVGRGPLTG